MTKCILITHKSRCFFFKKEGLKLFLTKFYRACGALLACLDATPLAESIIVVGGISRNAKETKF